MSIKETRVYVIDKVMTILEDRGPLEPGAKYPPYYEEVVKLLEMDIFFHFFLIRFREDPEDFDNVEDIIEDLRDIWNRGNF